MPVSEVSGRVTAVADEEPFLRRSTTLDAVDRIVSAKKLVFYFGAGVTRDQTGLGWDDLVLEVFRRAKRNTRRDADTNSRLSTLLQSAALPPQQKASLVIEHLIPRNETESSFLSRHLRHILYTARGWGEGHLLRSVAELCTTLASRGCEVAIATTNYDDYLLRYLERQLKELADIAPSLRAQALGSDLMLRELPSGHDSNGSVDLTFLHGAVTSDQTSDNDHHYGDLVFSERSYAATSDRTSEFLLSHLDPEAVFVVIGASMSDPPLVSTLIEAKNRRVFSISLMALPDSLRPPGGELESARAQDVLAKRASHIGVTQVLQPATFGQVAQFVEEVRVCDSYATIQPLVGGDYRTHASYPIRLAAWWDAWDSSGRSRKHDDHYVYLSVALSEIQERLESWGCPLDQDERLRLEMWLRLDPSVSRNHRKLTLYANSSGPILDERCRREEPISRSSRVASVQGFANGKASVSQLVGLGHDESASRWKSFLCVPIFYMVETLKTELDNGRQTHVSGTIPVGVITLSSTMPPYTNEHDTSIKSGRSAFTDPQLGNSEYEELLDLMIEAGLEIASP